MEELTLEICREYQRRAKELPDQDNRLYIGKRRELVEELMERCGLWEVYALNIVNGYHANDYIALAQEGKKKVEKKEAKQDYRDYLEWMAEKEEKERLESLIEMEEREL